MIVGIIQARLSSSRLPGKVLTEVCGKPLLHYLIERVKKIRNLDKFLVATTNSENDQPIVDFVKEAGIQVFRGSENNVLDRFKCAAEMLNAASILRITGDCPLLDYTLCDHAIETFRKSDVDLVHTGPSFCEGLDCEVISRSALERSWREAARPSQKEHVTLYIHQNPHKFRIVALNSETNDERFRFTVDSPEDLEVVRCIIENALKSDQKIADISTAEIKDFLSNNPEVSSINSEVIRNEGLIISLATDNEQE